MSKGGAVMRVLLLLVLIAILVLGGLLWFDYLGLVHTRGMFSKSAKKNWINSKVK